MVEGGGGTTFPVIFFDGEREFNIGDVRIEPKQVYKTFQFMLAQEIGISPNQISIYLVDRKKSKSSENRRKVPITSKANFAQICRERDCCFLVVLKRSRKARGRRAATPLTGEFENGEFVPNHVILLRRDQPPPFYDEIAAAELNSLKERLQNVRIQTENNYWEAMPQQYLNQYSFPRIEEAIPTMMMKKSTQRNFCEACTTAQKKGETVDFHHCVNDVVVREFRASGAGPIGPVRW